MAEAGAIVPGMNNGENQYLNPWGLESIQSPITALYYVQIKDFHNEAHSSGTLLLL